ncbi:MAG: polymer-forming cytoskeletal protein [Anaerolineaceae bacterium]
MSIWKEPTPARKEPAPMPQESAPRKEEDITRSSTNYNQPPRARAESKETLIAADLAIEGKIEGSGHVRVAGKFKGDVHVQGNLTIEPGAKVTGGVRASTVIIGGELEGNVDAASRVELLETGVLNGDLKAGSLTVAAGSRMRGQAEFGWDEKAQTSGLRMELGQAS